MGRVLSTLFCVVLALTCFTWAEPSNQWHFKLDYIPHSIEITAEQDYALVDGQPVKITAPKVINGRFYLEASAFKTLKLVTNINEQKTYVDLINTTNSYASFWVRYRFNQAYSFRLSSLGEFIQRDVNAKPLRIKGKLYLPFKYFNELLGRNIVYSKNRITLNWKELSIEKRELPKSTTENTYTVTILYDELLYMPIILDWTHQAGGGASLQSSGLKDEVLNDKRYKATKTVLNLTPGMNVFGIFQMKGHQSLSFAIEKIVEDPKSIPIEYLYDNFLDKSITEYILLTTPKSGFIHLKAGDTLPITGSLLQTLGDNQMEISVARFDGSKYAQLTREPLKTTKLSFNHTLTFKEKGFYLVEIFSPKHIPHIDGLLSTYWVKIRVKVD